MNTTFLDNPLEKWIYAVVVFLLSLVVLRLAKAIIHRRLLSLSKKTGTDIDDLIAELLVKIHFFLLFVIALYIGSMFLNLPKLATFIIDKLIIISLLIQGAIWGTGIISHVTERYKKQKISDDAASVTTITALSFVLRIILWSVIILLVLDNLGVNITALVAGLGVGGVAVALAVQNILGDLFASLSIVFDKPFVIGDFIIVDDYLGSVEYIGLKTTRIRSLSGEQLVISNSDLLQSRIRNFKRMFERRILFSIGVIYQTTPEKLAIIPSILQEIIEKHEKVRFDRAHFKEFADFSLNFEIVYWVKDQDYKVYMDIQQSINLEIFKRFADEGIEFAYPTQTIFVSPEGELINSAK